MTLNGFSPGTYTYSCDFVSGGNQSYTLSESTSPQTFDGGNTCYDTIPGDTVWVSINGVSSNKITVASASPPPPPSSTYAETVGVVTHTWSNYLNAGGTQGQSIAALGSVQVACRIQGFAVSDGNTWWYRIASSPWNSVYYASADAFYNNGQTSGSLSGTPYYDPNVPVC